MIAYLETQLPVALPVGSLLPGTAGVPYTPLTLTGVATPGYTANGPIQGGTAPFFWAATSGLPPGMILSSVGVLSGTPTVPGAYTLQITIQDSASTPTPIVLTSRTLVINSSGNLLSIVGPASLPAGTVGISYGPVPFTAAGGSGGPYTWSATGLPTGLAISNDGVLSGVPQANTQGSSNPQFTVKDSNNATATAGRSLTINPALPPCTGFSPPVNYLLSYQTTSMSWSFTTTPDVCSWTATGSPLIQTITPSSGIGGGVITATFAPNNTNSVVVDTVTVASGAVTLPLFVTRNPASCTLTASPPSLVFPAAGGTQTLSIVSNLPVCEWFLFSPNWAPVPLTLMVGSQTINLTASANPGSSPRTDTLSTYGAVDNPTIPVTQAGGVFNPFPAGGQALSSSFATGSISLTFPAGFSWTATTTANWIIFTGPTSGTGSGTLNYQVTANSGAARSGTITIAGYSYTLQQAAGSIPGLNFVGSMAHLAAQENWTTMFTLVNNTTAPATARFSFFGDAADPSGNGPLTVPVAFPQQTGLSGPLLASSFDQTLAANASLIVNSAGAPTSPLLQGSAQLQATASGVDGFAIFHQILTTQEAVVPMQTRNASSYLLAFDNTNNVVLGVAVENVTAQNAVIPVIIRDDKGVVISPFGTTISLVSNGHTSFVLSDPSGFPVTAGKRGTIEFDTPPGGWISVLGLRFTPPNNALTTIPPLANVGTSGGSFAHLASGGDGWQTTFVLVNTGTNAAQMTLSFFADQTGAPLNLPLSFPQAGSGNTTVAPSVTQILPAGATLLIVSSGAAQLLTGSAQLTTPGNISGFVIFRHNGQEAVVALESRNASGYAIAFDNTNGTATGIALNVVSTQAVNVPVVVRNDAGFQIAADTIPLNPNGHTQFTLVTDRYPGTANIRGTIEFDRPANGQIGALGIRIPTGGAHTYTTLPALTISGLTPVTELAALPCSLEGTIKSLTADSSTYITFSNLTSQTRIVYWLDYSGNRVLYNTLPPGISYMQQSYLTDPWVVATSSGQCLGIYLPVDGPNSVTITH